MTKPTRYLHASTVIESLRDSGYHNTAYALAELIDNSIQAKANRVEVGFIENPVNGSRKTYNVNEIIIWDNGNGMSPRDLELAMQFGGSKNKLDKNGMGKFGMGLPSSSISQCRRVDVWSWQNDSDPFHTYLDIDEMKTGNLEIIPTASPKPLPNKFKKLFFEHMPRSGTFILWSKLDRLTWKMGRTNFKHSEFLVGRMYRNFLSENLAKITATTYRQIGDDTLEAYEVNSFQANDPLYLMKNTSLPELPGDYKGQAFFELVDEAVIPIHYLKDNGEEVKGDVTIKTSIVKNNIAREILKLSKQNLGSTPWGKHCAKNIGVSIMRSNRELVIKNEFLNRDERSYKGRFYGIEVSFPPALDEIFGVTNNKQDAVQFKQYEIQELIENLGYETEHEFLESLKENNDPFFHTLSVIKELNVMLRDLRKRINNIQLTPTNHSFNVNEPDAADLATKGSENRERQGNRAREKENPKEEDITELLIREELANPKDATAKAAEIVESGKKFIIENAPRDSEAFFDVQTSKGLTLVVFNTNHIFYKEFIENLPDEKLKVMQLAIAGFARVMNETSNEKRVNYLNSIRRDWGKIITDFLIDSDDDIF